MKQIATVTLLALAVLLFAVPVPTLAQDTLVVYASGETLDKIINSDTTSTGALKHKAYKLVSLDTTYLFAGTITVKSDLALIGVPNPTTGRPPCIQPDVLPDNSIPGVLFTMNGKGTKGEFRNLYLLGIAINNTVNYGGGQGFQISADSIRLTLDKVVMEQWSQFAIGYSGNWDKFFITNCNFRNFNTQPNQWYVGEVLRNENYNGSFPTDSIVMKNNTIFSLGGYAAAPVATNRVAYFEFSHNNLLYNFKNPFFIHRATAAKFDNNIFYGTYAGGQSKAEYSGGWDELTIENGSVISLDTMNLTLDSLFNPGDVGNANLRWLSEAKRTIEVKNNAYFWPKALTDFWKAWNDTAHADSIYTPMWMNNRTVGMFADKTHWPGFTESGNVNVDPGFGPSIDSVLYPGKTSTDVGLLNWFAAVRKGSGTTEVWGYKITQVGSAGDWVPPWPLPEANDMKYTNATLKTGATDGGPIGDPNWFGIAVSVDEPQQGVPMEYALGQNYPNPFNPSTVISYQTPAAGNVKLVVYNLLGQEVATLVNGMVTAGKHEVRFDASRLASGIYLYKMTAGSYVSTMKMVVLK